MASPTTPRNTHIANDTGDTPARNKNAQALGPDAIQFVEKFFVDREATELVFVVPTAFP